MLDSEQNVLIVEDTRLEFFEKPVTVYNFEVEDFHTYHIGYCCILVHNASDYGKQQPPEQQKLNKESEMYDKRGWISQVEADDFIKRCRKAGFDSNKARIDGPHPDRMNPTILMAGTSGGAHVHVPKGKQHSLPIK